MAKNHVQPGKTLTYTNSGDVDIVSDAVVVFGAGIGIALVDIPKGKSGTIQVEEVFKLPKASGTAMPFGAAAYWDTTSKTVVAAEGENIVRAGFVAADAAAGATLVHVKINA